MGVAYKPNLSFCYYPESVDEGKFGVQVWHLAHKLAALLHHGGNSLKEGGREIGRGRRRWRRGREEEGEGKCWGRKKEKAISIHVGRRH